MSTWQARVRAPGECVVLMSGQNVALSIKDEETGNPLIPINKLNFIYTPHNFMYTALTVEKNM